MKTVAVHGKVFPRFSRVEIHPAVARILQPLPRGKLLDFPAGSGALSYRLSCNGFDVVACDLVPDNFIADPIPVVQGDLGKRFPFEDGEFDLASFVEGPEHTENPFHAFREFSRVLKPGGYLVVSIPNYTSIEARLGFLLWGSGEKAITPQLIETKYQGQSAMAHITPLTYTQLRFFLEASGFEIQAVAKDKTKWKQFLLYPLVLMIQAITWLSGDKGEKKWWAKKANSNAILLGGATLILLAKKSAVAQ